MAAALRGGVDEGCFGAKRAGLSLSSSVGICDRMSCGSVCFGDAATRLRRVIHQRQLCGFLHAGCGAEAAGAPSAAPAHQHLRHTAVVAAACLARKVSVARRAGLLRRCGAHRCYAEEYDGSAAAMQTVSTITAGLLLCWGG